MKNVVALASAVLLAVAVAVPAQAQDKAKPAAAPAKSETKADPKDRATGRSSWTTTRWSSRKCATSRDILVGIAGARQPGRARAHGWNPREKTSPTARRRPIVWKAGDVKYSPKETYSQKNIGKTELVLYSVTIK
jgi:hypothetical protein